MERVKHGYEETGKNEPRKNNIDNPFDKQIKIDG
jgi:hypothetical protein